MRYIPAYLHAYVPTYKLPPSYSFFFIFMFISSSVVSMMETLSILRGLYLNSGATLKEPPAIRARLVHHDVRYFISPLRTIHHVSIPKPHEILDDFAGTYSISHVPYLIFHVQYLELVTSKGYEV